MQKNITKTRIERIREEKKAKKAKRKASAWRVADWIVRLIIAAPQIAETFLKFFR